MRPLQTRRGSARPSSGAPRLRRLASAALPVLFGAVLAACGTTGRFLEVLGLEEAPPPDSALAYRVFLIGDCGDPPPDQYAVDLLEAWLKEAGPNSAVVFLGDNIYPSGMPPEGSPARADAEARIDHQLAALDSFPGRVVFVPGNHDWGGLGLGGNPEALRRQERYVEARLDRGNTFLPDGAFPGPAIVELADSVTLVAIDSQWWLEEDKQYGDTGQYFLETETEFLLELDDVLQRYGDTSLLVVAHHPVFTNGPHGGYFPGARRLNPFIFLSRGYLGTPQDLSNYKYRRLRDGLLSIFARHEGLVYAAGHEHALQYFAHDGQHYVVSGAGSKDGYVEEGHGASFVDEGRGFAVLDYFTDGSAWLAFYKAEPDDDEGRLLYRTRLKEGNRPAVAYQRPDAETDADARETVALDPADARPDSTTDGAADGETDGEAISVIIEEEVEDTSSVPVNPELFRPEIVPDGSADVPGATPPEPLPPVYQRLREDEPPYAFASRGTITVRAAPAYQTSRLGELVFGPHFRDVWAVPVEVPIIDLDRTAGGLTVLQRGGGLQTLSLRLQGGDGDQYVLRSINKDPGRSLPPYLLETVAHDVVQDQVSAMHPYGAFTLPRMAEAAGIFHTHPTLVYVPDDERLGMYRELFAGTLALFEMRADEEQRDEDRFGNPENIIGSPKLFEEINADNDHRVDQTAFARARLFDMLIGDWDRHSDQWRWSAFEPYELDPTLTGEARGQGKVYVPIPRDRDFAFFKFDGLLAMLARSSGVQEYRRLTNFTQRYGDLYGLNFNGNALDRRFTSELTRDDWARIAEDLRASLTDEVIDAAMRDLPPSVYAYHGPWMAAQLRSRRDLLPEAADDYYEILARTVDVVGSDKHERFEVNRLNDSETEVVVYKRTLDEGVKQQLYRRTFRHDETDEVRLYGLGGQDRFVLRRGGRDGLLVRIIGGPGDDAYVDSSATPGGARRTIVYETTRGNTWAVGRGVERVLSDDPAHNAYAMLRFERDIVAPLILVGRDADAGVELGGGVSIIEQGFRKLPYAARHRLGVEYGTRSGALHAFYYGDVTGFYGAWDGSLRADYRSEGRFRNFYGLGNETRLEDRAFYRADLGHLALAPSLKQTMWPFISFGFGPRFEFVNVEHSADGPTRFAPDDFLDKYYAGAGGFFEVDGTDSLANTRSGARWLTEVHSLVGVRNTRKLHARLRSEVSYFYTFDTPRQVTLAVRVGGAVTAGKFEFFHASTLGGEANLRGFRRTRFSGRHSFFQNVDLRVKLFDFNAYVTRGDFGALAFFDNGRVWADADPSGRWHQGYGAGFWASPFYQLVVTATLARSRENTLFDVSLGFLF